MMRRGVLVLLLPAVFLLVGCTPPGSLPAPVTSAAASASPTASAESEDTPTPAAPAASGEVDAETYLLQGKVGVLDADGVWFAHYGFYVDDTKAVRCDIWVFSGDDPGVLCAVTPGHESEVTYDLPTGPDIECDLSTSNPADGYSLALGAKSLPDPFLSGWSGCPETRPLDPGIAAATKVLGEGQQITVPPFSCVVNGHAAGCGYLDGSASIIMSLYTAVHAG